jgi:phage-related protein
MGLDSKLASIQIIVYLMLWKPVYWAGSSLEDLRRFPDNARRTAGQQLNRIQHGLMPNDFKSLPAVGPGVCEIRIRTDVEHRVMYVAKLVEGIYVLHAFEKRSQRIRRSDLDLARRRLADVLRNREG